MTREEAIEILKANYPDACFGQLRDAVDTAISALKQPEIIHCKECRNYEQYIYSGEVLGFCRRYIGEMPKPNDFCSWPDRRVENG